jgi:hypothetical protein
LSTELGIYTKVSPKAVRTAHIFITHAANEPAHSINTSGAN